MKTLSMGLKVIVWFFSLSSPIRRRSALDKERYLLRQVALS